MGAVIEEATGKIQEFEATLANAGADISSKSQELAEATNVFGVVHAKSPFFKPNARQAMWSAEVALLTAIPNLLPV